MGELKDRLAVFFAEFVPEGRPASYSTSRADIDRFISLDTEESPPAALGQVMDFVRRNIETQFPDYELNQLGLMRNPYKKGEVCALNEWHLDDYDPNRRRLFMAMGDVANIECAEIDYDSEEQLT